MNSKPVVALVLPPAAFAGMFGEDGLNDLKKVAEIRGPVGGEVRGRRTASEEAQRQADLKSALGAAEIAIAGWGSPRLDESLLSYAPRLRLLAYSAGSVKGIVSDALFARGIRVCTAAAPNARPVAEFTVAMIVAMLKQVPWISRGSLSADRMKQMRELQDMTIGLIGASRVGREVIRLLKAYHNLTIKLYDPYVLPDQAKAMGVARASLDEVCACEVVSVHAPNIPETRHMLNARTLALLPDHAILINTARGALLDEAALIAEVRRRPLYALLDVTDPEPVPPDSPLLREENILLTPHIAGAMKQARRDMGRLAVEEILRFLRGEALQHEVTQAMLATQA